MEKQLQQVIGLMQKNLECAICLELLKNPVSTKCDHQFCRFCIQEFLKTKVSVPCPLCKKPITKRSLVDRSNLSDIVDNVRSLISAFQEDTGQLFSPPRGSQMCFLPCTPETISCKSNTRSIKRKSAEDVPSVAKNVRQSKRRKSEPVTRGSHTLNKDDQLGEITQALLAEIEADDHSRIEPVEQVGSKHVGTVPSASSTLTNLENNRTSANQSHTNVWQSTRTTRQNGREKMKEKDEATVFEYPSRKETSHLLPSNDKTDLLNYLATESCGGVDLASTNSRRRTRSSLSRSSDEKLQKENGLDDVAIISENEQENIVDSEDDDNSVAVGQSLISLGNRAKTLKAKSTKEMGESERESTETDKRDRKESNNFKDEDDNDVGNEDGFILQKSRKYVASGMTIDKRETRSRSKNLVDYNLNSGTRRKSRELSSDPDEHQSHATENIFGVPAHNVTRTYSRKVKDNKVKRWLSNATGDLIDRCNKDRSADEENLNRDMSEDDIKHNQDMMNDEENLNQVLLEDDVDDVIELDSADEEEKKKENCFGFAALVEHVKTNEPQKIDRIIRKSDEKSCETVSESAVEAVAGYGHTPVDDDNKKTMRNNMDRTIIENSDVVTTVTVDEASCPVLPPDVEETVNMDLLTPIVGKRKKIFKSSNHGHVSMSVTQHKGKLSVTKVTEEPKKDSKSKPSPDKSGPKKTKDDSQGSDPYEFKSSQKTPVRGKQKNRKMRAKLNKKMPIDFKVKSQSKSKVEMKQIVIDLVEDDGKQNEQNCITSTVKQSIQVSPSENNFDREPKRRKKSPRQTVVKFEDLEKIKEDLCLAEEYDLITCTQEATDTLTEDTGGQSVVSEVDIIPDTNLEDERQSEQDEVIPDTNMENIGQHKFAVPLPIMHSASKLVGKKEASITKSSLDDESLSETVATANVKSRETGDNTEDLNSEDNMVTKKAEYRPDSCDSQDSAIPGTFEADTKKKNNKFSIRNQSKSRQSSDNEVSDAPKIPDSIENTNTSATTSYQAKNSVDSESSVCDYIPDTCNDDSESYGKKLKEEKTVSLIRKKSVSFVDEPADITDHDSKTSENTSGSGGVYDSHPHAKDHGRCTSVTVLAKESNRNSRKLKRRSKGDRRIDETESSSGRLTDFTESHTLDIETEIPENSMRTDKTEQMSAVGTSDKLEVELEVKNMAAENLAEDDVEGAVLEYMEKNLVDFNRHRHGLTLNENSGESANKYKGTNSQDSVSTQPPSVDMDVEMTNQITRNIEEDSTNGITRKLRQRHRLNEKNSQSSEKHKTCNKSQHEGVVLETQLSGSQTISCEDSVSLLQTTIEREKDAPKSDIVKNGKNLSKSKHTYVTSAVQEDSVEILTVPNNTAESTNSESQEDGKLQRKIRHSRMKRSPRISGQTSSLSACPQSKGVVDTTEESASIDKAQSSDRRLDSKSVDIVPCTAGASDDVSPIITIPTYMESQNGQQGNKISKQHMTRKKADVKERRIHDKKSDNTDSQNSVIVLTGSSAEEKPTQDEKPDKTIHEKQNTAEREGNAWNEDEDVQNLNEVKSRASRRHKNRALKTECSNRLNKKGTITENGELSVENIAITGDKNGGISVENVASTEGNEHTKTPTDSVMESKVLKNDQVEREDKKNPQLNCKSDVDVQNEDEDVNLTPVLDLDDNDVDDDDLTPTLVPLNKSRHSAKKVINHSPDDIFMMDSECVDSQPEKVEGVEHFSLVQNQEGIVGMGFQSVTSQVPDEISQVTYLSLSDSSQNPDNTKTGQNMQSEEITSRIDPHGDCPSNVEKEKSKDHKDKEKHNESGSTRRCTAVTCNTDGKKINSKEDESDSDLSQEPRRKSGVKVVRGLASRKRNLNNSIISSVQESCSNSCVNESQDTTTHVRGSDVGNRELNVENASHDDHCTESENTDFCENKDESVEIIGSVSIIAENKEPERIKDNNHESRKEGNQKQGVKLRKTFKKKSIYQFKTDVSSASAGSSSSVMSSKKSAKRKALEEAEIEHTCNDSDQDTGERRKPLTVIPDSSELKHLHEKSPEKHQLSGSDDEPDFSEIVEKGKMELNKKTEKKWLRKENQESCVKSQLRIDLGGKVRDNDEDVCQVVDESDDELFEASSPLPDFTITTDTTTAVEHTDNRISLHRNKLSTSKSRRKLSDEEDLDVDDDDNLVVKKKPPVLIDDDENEIPELANRNDEDNEEDDDVVTKKRKKPNVIDDDDEDENNENNNVQDTDSDGYTSDDSTTSRQLNLTSSSAFSSQSEAANTQNRQKLVTDLERMRKEIADLENQLAANVVPVPECSSNENHKKSEIFDEELEPDQEIQGNEDIMDLACSVSSTRSLSKSQTSRGSVLEESSDDSDKLILSPLPPSPPPDSAQINTEIQLPEALAKVDTFLDQFRIPNSETKKMARSSACTPVKSGVVLPSKDDGLHSSAKTDFRSPMFENRTQVVRSALSPIISYRDNSEEDSKSQRRKSFVATGLTYPQMRELQKLAQQNECKFYTKFNSAVTHVVVKTDPIGSCICERTLKFFLAISNKCWILDYQWVLDSRAAGHMLPETKYEVVGDTVTGDCHNGPRRSRTSTRPLLSRFQICCVGDSDGLTIDNLQELVTGCGGAIVLDPENLTDDSKIRLVVTCTDLDEEEDTPMPDEVRGFNQIYRKYGIVTVSREWVLDSLTVFNVQPLKEYVLTSVKRMRIPSLTN